jgi:uncharacterized protein YoxC
MSGPVSVRAVLDSVQANVFVADLELRLVYANRRALATCRTFADELRKSFGLGIDDLLNGSIHRFHSDPRRIERILADPSALPHRAIFGFGGVTLATTIAGVTDDQGRLLGYCVAWDDVSAQRRLENEVTRVADDLSSSAELLGELSGRLSTEATATAEQVGTVAAATEEMSASIRDIGTSTTSAVDLAADGVTAATSASTRIAQLSDSTAEIGGVVELITSIAAQTNLLALNATIEAARAGSAGRGFAVVANEVKDLARATSEATDRITGMIEGLRGDMHGATGAIGVITGLMDRISEGQGSVAAALTQQGSATEDISRSVNRVAGAASSTQQDVASLAEDAERLRAIVERLRGLLGEQRS